MQLPDRFKNKPECKQLSAYTKKRYTQYGYSAEPHGIAYNLESTHNHYRWVEYPENGLRLVGKAHEIATREGHYRTVTHTGWFVDEYQDETVCGLVYQLPARNHEPLYAPAVSDPWNEGALVDFHSVGSDLMDAVRQSDSMAEHFAEECREDNARNQAERRIEDINTQIKQAYAQFKALAIELRTNCDKLSGLSELHKLLKSHYRLVRTQVATLRRERNKLQNEF